MSNHPQRSASFLQDAERAAWHDRALWYVRQKRDIAAFGVKNWESLRSYASQAKSEAIERLGEYLLLFEQKAALNGAQVHWAKDARGCNETVTRILREANVSQVVKSKSMLTEECGLNPYLESQGISVVDTDLGERIVQLRQEHPSHIVLPAIHLKREDVGELFHKHLDTPQGESDPARLTEYARHHLRELYKHSQATISGANFLVADTGTVVVCTNEGNFDLGVSLTPLHIVCVGIEKIVPSLKDLSVFLRLLARSATGQPITVYTSHISQPRSGGALHIVLVDNGRSDQRRHPIFRQSLKCIRCGACLNTCPIYRRSGGHSYGWTIPGPIGSVLAPLRDSEQHKCLPNASSLCGSCTAVCPVKIPLHEHLLAWRGELFRKGKLSIFKRVNLKIAAWVLLSSARFNFFGRLMRSALTYLPRAVVYCRSNVWGRERELPAASEESFKEWYRLNKLGKS